jgi:hypothetical protein
LILAQGFDEERSAMKSASLAEVEATEAELQSKAAYLKKLDDTWLHNSSKWKRRWKQRSNKWNYENPPTILPS